MLYWLFIFLYCCFTGLTAQNISNNQDAGQFKFSGVSIPKDFALVEGGTFMMGSNEGESKEQPVHQVTVSSFSIGKYEVNQKEWQDLMGSNPSHWKGDNLPVEQVNWYDAVEYCNKRSLEEGLKPCYSGSGENTTCDWTANGYRLPTEAEWEYAARGGKLSKNYKYSGSNEIDKVAWYNSNTASKPHKVGIKAANELGIYDMSGNVWELCWDFYESYPSASQNDPKGASNGEHPVLRGGSWSNYDYDCRVFTRSFSDPDYKSINFGIRLLRRL